MSGALVIWRQNEFMRRFREMGAMSPASAMRLDELRIRESWLFRRMSARGVFVRTDDDRYYMNAAAERNFIQRRRILVSTVTTILVLIFILFLLFAR